MNIAEWQQYEVDVSGR